MTVNLTRIIEKYPQLAKWETQKEMMEMFEEVTQTKDGRSKNLTRTRNVPPKCNKQVTSKQQTGSFLTSIN
jgi:hypothetical protein